MHGGALSGAPDSLRSSASFELFLLVSMSSLLEFMDVIHFLGFGCRFSVFGVWLPF